MCVSLSLSLSLSFSVSPELVRTTHWRNLALPIAPINIITNCFYDFDPTTKAFFNCVANMKNVDALFPLTRKDKSDKRFAQAVGHPRLAPPCGSREAGIFSWKIEPAN